MRNAMLIAVLVASAWSTSSMTTEPSPGCCASGRDGGQRMVTLEPVHVISFRSRGDGGDPQPD